MQIHVFLKTDSGLSFFVLAYFIKQINHNLCIYTLIKARLACKSVIIARLLSRAFFLLLRRNDDNMVLHGCNFINRPEKTAEQVKMMTKLRQQNNIDEVMTLQDLF